MSAGHTSDHVTVLLTDCVPEDARAVFDSLGARFPEEGEPERVAVGPKGRSRVWSATYDVYEARGAKRAAALAGGVTADISGCPQPVKRLRKALEDSFSVQDKGHASGDQELEVYLRITGQPS